MDGENPFDALKLQHDLLINYQIHLVTTIKLQTFVGNRQINLPLEGQTT